MDLQSVELAPPPPTLVWAATGCFRNNADIHLPDDVCLDSLHLKSEGNVVCSRLDKMGDAEEDEVANEDDLDVSLQHCGCWWCERPLLQ